MIEIIKILETTVSLKDKIKELWDLSIYLYLKILLPTYIIIQTLISQW